MDTKNYGFIFAFQVLPTIIFFSALMGVMYHLNIMQAIVRVMAWAITKVMRVSGAEPPASAPASSSARPRRR